MKADTKTEAEATAVINKFLKAYTGRDIERTLAFLKTDHGSRQP